MGEQPVECALAITEAPHVYAKIIAGGFPKLNQIECGRKSRKENSFLQGGVVFVARPDGARKGVEIAEGVTADESAAVTEQ